MSGGQAGAAQDTSARYAPDDQQLIYTAQLTVRAKNVGAALSTATSIVTAAGGYVSAENSSGAAAGQPASSATATVTLKIPAAVYPATLAGLTGAGLGTQLSLQQQAQDVTQQVADVSSRVASDQAAISPAARAAQGRRERRRPAQRAGPDQHRGVRPGVDARAAAGAQPRDRLRDGDAHPGRAEGRRQGEAEAKPAPPPGLASGLTGGWRAFRLTIDWLLAFIGAVAPFAAVVAVIGGAVWWARRRVTHRGRTPADGQTSPSGSGP